MSAKDSSASGLPAFRPLWLGSLIRKNHEQIENPGWVERAPTEGPVWLGSIARRRIHSHAVVPPAQVDKAVAEQGQGEVVDLDARREESANDAALGSLVTGELGMSLRVA